MDKLEKQKGMKTCNSIAQLVVKQLKKISRSRPTLAIVLGSGFHSVADALAAEAEIPYTKLPGFPRPSVGGHAGKVLLGELAGTPVLLLCGRAHYYEGFSMEEVTFPIRVLAAFGIRSVLLTNAAGGINRRFRAGDFMVLTDHINFMGANPLRGAVANDQSRFVDLNHAYDPDLNRLVKRAARETGITLYSGVYLAVSGPSYETPAEIRAFARLGADAVGMSTVPEAIVARQCGMRVAAVSCITNLAAGRGRRPLSHAEVLSRAAQVQRRATGWLEAFARLHRQSL
jgi:inosine/guanosine/xanthosine phosphorylase family protein